MFSILATTKQQINNLQDVLELDNFILPNMFSGIGVPSIQVDVNPIIGFRNAVKDDDNLLSTIQCTPSPFEDEIYISLNHTGPLSASDVKLYNALGVMVLQEKFTIPKGENLLIIDQLDYLQPGLYFLDVLLNGSRQSIKVIKK